MDQKIIGLFDRYTHSKMDRREFLARLTQLAGSTAAVAVLLPMLEGSEAIAYQIAEDDDRLITGYEHYEGADPMTAYIATLAPLEKRPAVIVIHQNRGLTAHIRDVARRMALEGFLAIAPDALSAIGASTDDTTVGRERMRELDRERTLQNFLAAAEFAANHPNGTGKVGVTGFCWGGSMTGQLSTLSPHVSAGAVYYGSPPSAEAVAAMNKQVPIIGHYGGLDERINQQLPAFEEALKAAGINHHLYMYENANHAFNDDTSSARYDEAASTLAWARTVEFFKSHLGS